MRTINILGKEVKLKEDNYLIAKDTGKLVLKNQFLRDVAKKVGISEPTASVIPEGCNASKGIYLVKASVVFNGVTYEEWGEANPLNLKNDISKENPANLARSRAITRVLIRALELGGNVLSEDEIDRSLTKKEDFMLEKPTQEQANYVPKENLEDKPQDSPVKTKDNKMTKEELIRRAGETIMHFGIDKGVKVADFNELTVDYVLNKMKARESDKTKKLYIATKIYHAA